MSGENEVFTPQQTLDHPFDVTLVVQNGTEFKAHRRVLSESSPYFKTLLNSGMKESKEGVVRFETFSEAAMRGTLEFIYTGSVYILTQESAMDLFTMADYLILPTLKSLAESALLSLQTLDVSNCISTYYFADKFQCKELASKTELFILANFTTVARTEHFLNLSSKEVEMWISRDEIDVFAEEDVFNIILYWIDGDKSERTKYFAELFRHIRLVFVSRDCLCNDIVTNDLVKTNEGCLDRVLKAIELVHSENFENLSVKPRKSLETPVIVVCVEIFILCYFPREDRWCELSADNIISDLKDYELASCRGKLYFLNPLNCCQLVTRLLCYDSLPNSWESLQYKEERYLKQVFVRNDDDLYALVSGKCQVCDNLSCLCWQPSSRRTKPKSTITKYKAESNTWEDICSCDFGLREGMCIVSKDDFIYFIGGGVMVHQTKESLRDADRYNLTTNQWDKVADTQQQRMFACGAATQGKVFIAGGVGHQGGKVSNTCEMYNETTNEWQFVASLIWSPGVLSNMMCVDGKLYVVGGCPRLQCYDSERNEWDDNIELPICPKAYKECYFNACSMRVFTRFLGHLNNGSLPSPNKRKCFIM